MRVLVTGASGFLGQHLARALEARGDTVVGIGRERDLRDPAVIGTRLPDVDAVYDLAATAGGVGSTVAPSTVYADNLRVSLNTLEAVARRYRQLGRPSRYLFASSAAVYPAVLQQGAGHRLHEGDAFQGAPDSAYAMQKLAHEQACRYFAADYPGLETRVVRYGALFGPGMAWDGPKATVVGALCRKIATAKLAGERTIEVWGDGEQRRGLCYVGDAVDGTLLVMDGAYGEPVNIGSDQAVSVKELAVLLAEIAAWPVTLAHVPGPEGMRTRSVDLRRARTRYGWSPTTPLKAGLTKTYTAIEQAVAGKVVAYA